MPHLLPSILPFAPNTPPLLGLLLAIAGVFITGIGKAGFGGGVGILAVPLFALAFGAQQGNAILLPILVACDIFSVYHHFGNWHKPTLKILAPGTLLGILIGSLILYLVIFGPTFPPDFSNVNPHIKSPSQQHSENALNLLTGIISILYVLLDQIRQRFAPHWHIKPNAKSGFVAGASVGIVSTLAHAAGPVAAIFLLNVNLSRTAFMGTTVIYFLGVNLCKLPAYIALRLLTLQTLAAAAVFFIFVPLGTWFGAYLCRRVSDKTFRQVIMILIFITGLQLTLETLTGINLAQLFTRH